MRTIAERAQALLGTTVVATSPVAGGDINTATRLRLSDGRHAFLKTRPHAPADFFHVEAAGLGWLRTADGAAVPEVLAVADDCLILQWVEPGRASVDAAETFARALARTHQTGADTFGGPANGYIATLPLVNEPVQGWQDFYVRQRVLPYLKLARDRDAVSQQAVAAIEQVLRHIDEFAGLDESPSRIHGDLWSGNLVWSTGGTTYVVDPAAHGGHRLTDLAMLSLFGAPHLSRILDAYDEAAPLASGWRDQLPLHQLHPLLVHAAMFGGSYGDRAMAAARSLLDARTATG